MTDIPPGWYADPEHGDQNRYWDGRQWTEHRAPRSPADRTDTSATAWQVVPESLTLLGRCWRELVVLVVPLLLVSVVGAVVVARGFDAALDPGLESIIERISEPGFDPNTDPSDEAFLDSIRFEVDGGVVLAWILGGLAVLVAQLLAPILMTVHLASRNGDHTLSLGDTVRATARKLPRIIGVAILWTIVAVFVLAAITVASGLVVAASPFALLLIVPAILALLVYAWPYGHLAPTMLVITPPDTAPFRSTVALVRGRWGAVSARVLVLSVVLFAVAAGVNLVSAPLGLASVWAGAVVALLAQLVQLALMSAGNVVILGWAGAPVDPALVSSAPGELDPQ